MIEFSPIKNRGLTRISSQPIALAATIFVVLVAGAASIAMWRSYTGTTPEPDRVVAVRQLQARTAQASEQLLFAGRAGPV